MTEKGQVVLMLILVMTVALAIGLSVIQRSLTDISTSSKVEQSSRAFSAAEAGIERALLGDTSGVTFSGNNSSATVTSNLIPVVPSSNTRQDPLEYPPLAKEETATVWLADYNSTSNPPAEVYKQDSLDIYWGNSTTDRAALELTLIYYNDSANKYDYKKWYLDQVTRTPANNFDTMADCRGFIFGSNNYQCKYTISSLPAKLMLLRARLLYNSTSQPFAVQAVGTRGIESCTNSAPCWLPSQVKVLNSTGISGGTQRKVRLFQIDKVVPSYFDYAIFSAGDINK